MTVIGWTPPLGQTRGEVHIAGTAYPAVLHIDRDLHTLRYEWCVRAGVPTREAWELRGQILEVAFHTDGGAVYAGTAAIVEMSNSQFCGEMAKLRGASPLVPLDDTVSGLDGMGPRDLFAQDAAAFKVQERLRMAYAPGRTWLRPVDPPSRWARLWSRLLWWRR
jgi:hypothetical protein